MKAVRVHAYHKPPSLDDVPEPTLQGPLDVIVKIGGAGVCRTDLHILEGQWAEAMNPELPYTIGHENAGWVHADRRWRHERGGGGHRDPASAAQLRAVPAPAVGARTCSARTRSSPVCPTTTAGWPSTCAPPPGPASS